MDDHETVKLITDIARYFNEYSESGQDPDEMTVTELVEDLAMSLDQNGPPIANSVCEVLGLDQPQYGERRAIDPLA